MDTEYTVYVLFSILASLYIIQLIISVNRASQSVVYPSTSKKKRITTVHQAARVFDGGIRNNYWSFGILAVFLPVTLAVLADIIISENLTFTTPASNQLIEALQFATERSDLFGESREFNEFWRLFIGYYESGVTDAQRNAFPLDTWIHLFMTILIVLIALEFSYIHNLRRVKSDWVSMLLVASTLDFATLLAIVFSSQGDLDAFELPFMGITTFTALVSTYFVLVYSRVSGALSENQVRWRDLKEDKRRKTQQLQRRVRRLRKLDE